MSPVRIGAVGYLNARPLVFDLEQDARFDVRFDLPARCADLLHAGQTDLGLIPSIELLRAPGGPDAYRIVPDLAIASRGPVASVAIFTTRDMRDVRSISLDTSSRTSVALTRVMCARVFGIEPGFEGHGPDLPAMLEEADAALIIGDQALFLDGGPVVVGEGVRTRTVTVEKIDLGQLWLQTTGLPFVYAFWAGRPGAVGPDEVRALQATREASLGRTREISEFYFPGDPVRQDISDRYLRDNIKYYLGPDERAALELFYRYAAEAHVVPRAVTPNFFENPG
jgi:chorismate dehydratase